MKRCSLLCLCLEIMTKVIKGLSEAPIDHLGVTKERNHGLRYTTLQKAPDGPHDAVNQDTTTHTHTICR